MVLLACTTFLFAGVYPSSLPIPALILAALVAVNRPWRAAGPPPPLHLWLKAIIIAMAVQLVPLPPGLNERRAVLTEPLAC